MTTVILLIADAISFNKNEEKVVLENMYIYKN
jgi:hypothetical protein